MESEKRKVGRPMGRRHQDDVRAKIQAGQLIKVLQNHALNENDSDLPASRIKAAEILLRKSLPDLSAVTVAGDADNPLVVAQALVLDADSLRAKLRKSK